MLLAPKITEPPEPLQYVYRDRKSGKDGDERAAFAVTLKCGAKDYDTVKWQTSGKPENLAPFVDSDKSLHLPHITEGQSASTSGTDYWCCASNVVGTVCSTNGTLVYASFASDKWIELPSTISAFDGFDAVIPCRVPPDTKPPATVEWTVNGTVIDPSDASDEYTYAPSGDLEIDIVTMKLHGSIYRCKVTNYLVTYSYSSGVNTVLYVHGKQQ